MFSMLKGLLKGITPAGAIKGKAMLVIGGLIIGFMVFKYFSLSWEIDELNEDVSNLEERLELELERKTTLKNQKSILEENNRELVVEIQNMNEQIDAISIDYNKKVLEFEKWKNKPPEIKYKTKIKKVMDMSIKKDLDVCEQTLKTLEAVKELNYEDF